MSENETFEPARRGERESVREEMHRARESKHLRSTTPSIAIELGEPSRGGLGPPPPASAPPAGAPPESAPTVTGEQPESAPDPADDVDPGLPLVDLHGVPIHAVTEREAIEHVLGALAHGRGGSVITPNLDHLYRFHADPEFAAQLREADLVVPDGMPLIWASRIQGTPLPARVAGSDLIGSLSAAAAQQGRSVFLLGGNPGSAEGAAKALSAKAPGLRVAGTLCPPFGFEADDAEMARIETALRAAAPDIVFVGLGSPKQERLIRRLRGALPASWWLGIGAGFSFLAGDVKRAPRWMQVWGLEWAHRLAQEPRRLFERYVMIGLPFGAKLIGHATLRRMRLAEMPSPGELARPRAGRAGVPSVERPRARPPVDGIAAAPEP